MAARVCTLHRHFSEGMFPDMVSACAAVRAWAWLTLCFLVLNSHFSATCAAARENSKCEGCRSLHFRFLNCLRGSDHLRDGIYNR